MRLKRPVIRTLQIRQQLTHQLAENEVSQERADEREWHAEDAQKQIRDGEVEQEQIGYRSHPPALDQREYN
jgi:hypothetical protein